MNEGEFWAALEFRVCREFAGMTDRNLRRLWCDGFVPERYSLDESPPRIAGRTWICEGQRQEEWAFTLILGHATHSRESIDWRSLLPPEDITRWLAVDPAGKAIQIEPSAAAVDRHQDVASDQSS